MNEKELHTNAERLIARYLSGEATDVEVRELETWVRQQPENREQFLKTRQAFNLSEGSDGMNWDVEKAWKKVSDQAGLESSPPVRQRSRTIPLRTFRGWSVAAAILVLAAVSIWFFTDLGRGDTGQFYQSNTMALIEEKLPDGSLLSLNRYSEANFVADDTRRVALSGEAFFEVKRDEHKPFTVDAGEVKIRVLGTAFNVSAYSDSPYIEVMVQSGTVSVNSLSDSLILEAGQQVRYDKESKTMVTSGIDDRNFLAWKTKYLIFSDVPLVEVAEKLNEVYDIQLILSNPNLENCKITVAFDNQEPGAIVSIIRETLDLSVRQKGNIFELNGPGCE